MLKYCLFLCGLLLRPAPSTAQALPAPLPRSHAHNDYAHRKPLLDALDQGFQSIEIDVFPRGRKLKVAHIPGFLWLKKDIERLYIKPFARRFRHNPEAWQARRVIFMVDIKEKPARCYALMQQITAKYPDLFHRQGHTDGKPLEILFSGAKPWDEVLADTSGLFALDGNPGHASDHRFSHLKMPRVSSAYSSHFTWRGEGAMPEKERAELRRLVALAHDNGRQIRFWAMPQHPNVWAVFAEMGVDWLNIDDLKGYAAWTRQNGK